MFQSGTILDDGYGESGFMSSPKNPGVTSGLGDVGLSGTGLNLQKLLRDQWQEGDQPAYGFFASLLRHGI